MDRVDFVHNEVCPFLLTPGSCLLLSLVKFLLERKIIILLKSSFSNGSYYKERVLNEMNLATDFNSNHLTAATAGQGTSTVSGTAGRGCTCATR